MENSFFQRLRGLGKEPTQQTICLQNTRLGDKYLIFDLIAVGHHSTIYYGIQEASKEERIFKFYNLKQIENKKGFKEKQLCKRLSNYQYSLRKKCDSIHIIKQYDIYQDRASKIVVSEYCNLGSLESQIKKRANKLTDQLKAIVILKQIVSGIKNIHKNCQILHKNLKANNILIQDGIYKIIDFGIPIGVDDKQAQDILVPQILLKKDYDNKAEVWSIGVLFHQILFGEPPTALTYNSENILVSNSVRCIFQDKDYSCDKCVKQFLENCLSTNPLDRMSWQQLQNHQIFKLIQPQSPKNKQQPQKPQKSQKYQQFDTLFDDRMSAMLPIYQNEERQQQISQSMQQSMSFTIQVPNQFYSRKFNLQKEIKLIDSELQQPYQKFGDYLQFKQLQPVSIEHLRKRINKDMHIQYEQLKSYYLQCLKVDFVYYDIIIELKRATQSQHSRQLAEFLYLLICRCFFQMSRLNVIVGEYKFRSKQQNILISCIKKQTGSLYNKVIKDWNYYSKLMNQYENKFYSIIADKFAKLLNSQEFERKNEILVGIQGVDFQKDEQIQLTFELYKNENFKKQLLQLINKQLKQQIVQKSNIMKYLDRYLQIWNIKNLPQSYMDVKQYIDELYFKKVQNQEENN